MKLGKSFLHILMTVAFVLTSFTALPARPAIAGTCYRIGDVLAAHVSEREGAYIAIESSPTPYSDSAIRFTMVKSDPDNRRFTNSGRYWLQAFDSSLGSWVQISPTYSYNGQTQDWYYQATINPWHAPQGEVHVRFALISDNDPTARKYSNRVVIENHCQF